MKIGVLDIKQIAWHRNGMSGVGFNAILFRDLKERADFVATLYEDEGYCSVLRVPDLSDPDKGVEFGTNSWRGDRYEPSLREAVERWEQEQKERSRDETDQE